MPRNPDSFLVFVDRNIRKQTLDVVLTRSGPDGQLFCTKPELVPLSADGAMADVPACLELTYDTANEFMKELYNAGIRLPEQFGVGERQAMQAHMQSLEAQVLFLRSLVTHQLGIVS